MSDDFKIVLMLSAWFVCAMIMFIIMLRQYCAYARKRGEKIDHREILNVLCLCIILWPAGVYELIDGSASNRVLPGSDW
jgi:CDP-diglyceride synthetase